MKKILIFIVTLSCICLISCGGKKTKLTVNITEQPVGGVNITELRCSFEGQLYDGTTPITVMLEWWWQDAYGVNEVCQHREEYTFSEDYYVEYTSILSAQQGYVFYQYFWAKIIWIDEDGTDTELESSMVHCYYSNQNSNDKPEALAQKVQLPCP